MPSFIRVTIIEIVRLLSLSSAAVSSFLFGAFAHSLILTPFSIYYGDLGISNLEGVAISMIIAFGPTVMVVYVPEIAAKAFDIRFGGRRLSQLEMEIVRKIEQQLQTCAETPSVKLPQVAWRVQDTGEINAYAYAHNRVCYTKGILHKYSDTQAGIERLAGIAAHEIGHLRHWDTHTNMFLHYMTMPVNFGGPLANNTISRIPIAGLISTVATILFRIPCDIAQLLNESTSQLREYQADRFACKLMNGIGISGFLDDINHLDERKGDTFTQWMLRSHPPIELRHDELARTTK
ncbi:MAG: M48 family metalloprotease [Roseibium sp.]|uniref:M48 family metalloprotease n=1 Tax=Roseibium sp. TaxID=1936156 RepID=UPI00260C4581|nr:M48 family metalloprotease [Roseibium sp.]MCV0424138.1 M48 family metalloprotease [Roseibium sp.]